MPASPAPSGALSVQLTCQLLGSALPLDHALAEITVLLPVWRVQATPLPAVPQPAETVRPLKLSWAISVPPAVGMTGVGVGVAVAVDVGVAVEVGTGVLVGAAVGVPVAVGMGVLVE